MNRAIISIQIPIGNYGADNINFLGDIPVRTSQDNNLPKTSRSTLQDNECHLTSRIVMNQMTSIL
jgi:hypothetical protein